MLKRSSYLDPSEYGLGCVYLKDHGVNLMIGNISNSALALNTGTLQGIIVTHIICVASPKKADKVATLCHPSSPTFHRFFVQDRLAPDEDVDLSVLEGPIQAVVDAISVQSTGAAEVLPMLQLSRTEKSAQMPVELSFLVPTPQTCKAILVHCDMGHNRSPSIAILSLLRVGYTLREAYRLVLTAKPDVDPLPSYRRLFRTTEVGIPHAQICHQFLESFLMQYI